MAEKGILNNVGSWNDAGGPLTQDELFRAAEAIRNQKPSPCSLGEHVVNPKALYRPGLFRCANCGAPVVTMPLSERRPLSLRVNQP